MFYLIEFNKIFFKMGLRGFFFILSSILLSTSLHFRQDLHQVSEALSVRSFVKPYFTVFFDKDVNVEMIKSKIAQFPKVVQVQDVATKEGLSAWWDVLKEIGEDTENQALSYQGLRILMNQNIANLDSSFILSSIKKMAGGEEHLTSSSVKYPREEKFLSLHPFFKTLSYFHEWTFIVPLALIWIILFFMTKPNLLTKSFILENFQRKTMVAPKVLGAGLVLIFISTLFLSFVAHQGIDLVGLVTSITIFGTAWAMTLRGSRWHTDI